MGQGTRGRKRRRGAGHLYLRGATWWGRLRIGDAELKQSLRTGSRADAQRKLDEWARREAGDRPGPGAAARHAWQAALVRWAAEIAPGLRPGTVKRYTTSFDQLRAELDTRAVEDLTLPALLEILGRRRAAGGRRGGHGETRPLSNATINRDITALSSVLGACAAWRWIPENPLERYDRRRLTRERRAPFKIPGDGDVAAMLARAPGGFGALLAFLAETGMRQEEAASLEWSDLAPDLATVTLTRTKTHRPRTLGLRAPAIAILRARPRHLRLPFVFWHEADNDIGAARYTTVPTRFRVLGRSLAKAATAARPFRPFRCHDLRHRFAVERLKEGWDIYTLARYMGHSTVKTTEIYLGYVPGGAPVARTGADTPVDPPQIRDTIRGTATRKKSRKHQKRRAKAIG